MPKSKGKSDDLPPSGKAGKRRKQDGAVQPGGASSTASDTLLANPLDILNPALLTEASSTALQEQYQSAEPYTHCVMRDLFRPEALVRVRDEIITNIRATYKETDLFKVFQTGDLGNLDRLDKAAAAKLPTLMALKAAVYSPEFRAFVRKVTGCGELADKTDTSCNIYAPGGHLLCHDDVIGTRRVSWIIYLTDPERTWTAEDGGALELYPLEQGQQHTPAVHPSVSLLPTFNTMAMFTVLPGKSFHAVQEVMPVGKPRMSISGWYHAPMEPVDMHQASLQQLQARRTEPQAAAQAGGEQGEGNPLIAGEDNVAAGEFQPFTQQGGASSGVAPDPASEGLSEDDLSFLIRYVNPAYLAEAAWPKIQARFSEDGSIQLQQFLAKGLAERIAKAVRAADQAEGLGNNTLPPYTAGLHGGWEAVGPPHKQRYLRYAGGEAAANGGAQQQNGQQDATEACKAAGDLLAQVRDTLFRSSAFQRLLRAMTTLNMVGQRGEARRFRPGLDYTVAHYGILTHEPRLDVVLCFVDDEGQQAPGEPSVWNDGEVGGYEAYLLADEDKEGAAAAEVYRQDQEESGVLNVGAARNSLNLVLRDEGLMKFVKYVSAAAPGSRWDVAMEYLPEDDSDDEEEEEEKEKKESKEVVKDQAHKPEDKATEKQDGKGGRKGRKQHKEDEQERPVVAKENKGKAKRKAGKVETSVEEPAEGGQMESVGEGQQVLGAAGEAKGKQKGKVKAQKRGEGQAGAVEKSAPAGDAAPVAAEAQKVKGKKKSEKPEGKAVAPDEGKQPAKKRKA